MVNPDNGRDFFQLNRFTVPLAVNILLERLAASSSTRLSNNMSMMPLDVLDYTRTTLKGSACLSLTRGAGTLLSPLLGTEWSL